MNLAKNRWTLENGWGVLFWFINLSIAWPLITHETSYSFWSQPVLSPIHTTQTKPGLYQVSFKPRLVLPQIRFCSVDTSFLDSPQVEVKPSLSGLNISLNNAAKKFPMKFWGRLYTLFSVAQWCSILSSQFWNQSKCWMGSLKTLLL